MWNSYWSGRPRRNLPQVNYNDSSEEDDYNSPLVSPTRPPPTRAGSPVELAVPTLNDNVDEELAAVSQTLSNVGHTHTFRGTRPDPIGGDQASDLNENKSQDDFSEEIVNEGFVTGGAEHGVEMAGGGDLDFEAENGADGAKALEYTRTLKIEFDPAEVEFWFTQIENEMYTCEVKSQWLKRCVLVKNLPPKIQADVKSLLTLKKSEAPDDLYKQIKDEILRIHAPRAEDTFKKALSRVLTGLPSQLGEQLVNDICKHPIKLSCGCCPAAVYTLWTMQLPQAVRGHVADRPFNKNTYREVFQAADKIYLSTKSTELSSSVAAVVNTDVESGEVAAVKSKKWNRGGAGRKPNKPNNSGATGSDGGGGRGPRHSSNPPSSCCDNHYRWGASSWFCLSPTSCPWKDKVVAKPEKKKKEEKK